MFELLFKYPASTFAKGKIVFLALWPLWVGLLLTVAIAAFLIWSARRRTVRMSAARKAAVLSLEVAFLALLLLLLWRPALSVARLRPQQNVIAILLDTSRSMGTDEDGRTRLEQAKETLSGGLLGGLSSQFQVHLYEFGDDSGRIADAAKTSANRPATHIGESIDHVLAESHGLPLGALVLLSDGADNSGGVDAGTIAKLRQQRVPVYTIGFGREREERDLEIEDVTIPQRALPGSRVVAAVRFRQTGFAGRKAKLTVRDGASILASREIDLAKDAVAQTEPVLLNAGAEGAHVLQVRIEPLPGETNADNNALSRLLNVTARKPRIFYFEGEPRWEYKFIRRAADLDQQIELVSLLRTTQNKFYRQGISSPNELADGFPAKAEDLFAYDGLIIGSSEANFLTPSQQEAVRDFASRRGGGVVFLGGRFGLTDGGYGRTAIAEMLPVSLPEAAKGPTFLREYATAELTPAGRDSILCRMEDDPAKNEEKWKKLPQIANSQFVGDPKPGAVTLVTVLAPGRKRSPLLVTQNYGRGRVAVLATGGTWRWKMRQDHNDLSHETFWRQMLRWAGSETNGRVVASTPHQVLNDEAKVPLRVEVRDAAYRPVSDAEVQGRAVLPDGSSAAIRFEPAPLEEGVYTAEWKAERPGAYLIETVAAQGGKETGRDVVTLRRDNGVAERFHTTQNRELLEKLSAQTGGRYVLPRNARDLSRTIGYSEAGVSAHEMLDLWDMPAVLLLALALRGSEWLLRRKWGAV